jgi:hypothetical protein
MGVSVIVAVYTVDPANGLPVGLQDTVPVYSVSVPVTIIGVPPVAGAVTPGIAKSVIMIGAAVAGNTAVATPELTKLVAVAPATVKELAATPAKV